MKNFIINTCLFSVICLFLIQLPNLFFSPYYGNKYYIDKHEYFTKNQDKYNAVILGSSRLYRHMNPKILDDILKDYKTSTFNLAAPATTNPEVYYLYEKLLETIPKNHLNYAFVELQTLNKIKNKNLTSVRNYYFHNLESLSFSIKYCLASNRLFNRKIEMINKYILSYVYKILNPFSGYKEITSNKSNAKGLYIGKNKDGFYSLDEQMSDIGGINHLTKRSTSFLKNDSTFLEKKISRANKIFSRKNNVQFINETHLKKAKDLIEKSKQRGVHLIFIIPPDTSARKELIAIKEKLPSKHIIEIANPKKYPKLYQIEFTFDRGHLNKKGANLFTKYVANEILMGKYF